MPFQGSPGLGELADELASLTRVLLAAAGHRDAGVAITQRDDGTLRVVCETLGPQESERMTLALAELLGPVVGQRYLIEEPLWRVHGGGINAALAKGYRTRRVFGVPRSMARSASAQRLLACWQTLRNPDAALHHRESAEGHQLLTEHLRRTPLGGEVAIRDVWR